jgi:hypothetical protein
MPTKCYTWDELNLLWKDVNWTWEECQLVDELVSEIGSGALDPSQIPSPWDGEKKKKLIRLICKVKGYTQTETEKEVKKNGNITINDIKLVVKAVKNIDLTVTTNNKNDKNVLTID